MDERVLEKITALVGIQGPFRERPGEREGDKKEDTRKVLVRYFTYVTTIRHRRTGPCITLPEYICHDNAKPVSLYFRYPSFRPREMSRHLSL